MVDEDEEAVVDLNDPGVVEVQIGPSGQLWVNVDGRCRFRAYRIKRLILEDQRTAAKFSVERFGYGGNEYEGD